MGVMATRRWAVIAALCAVAACSRGFQLRRYPAPADLFTASVAELQKRKWDNAVAGFEKLTLDLSARDTLLPLAHWYLARAHEGKKEFLLASTSYARVAESFPDDTLADDAMLASGDAYLRLWRKPELDPQYGALAQLQYRQLLGVYPDSPLADTAEVRLLAIDERFAAKDYGNGMYYVRRGAYDSSIILFKDVVKNYANTDHARLALMRMVEVYRRPQMNYREEAAETCATLRTAYAGDPDVQKLCPPPGDSVTVAPPGRGPAGR